jgi:hypothetical protein
VSRDRELRHLQARQRVVVARVSPRAIGTVPRALAASIVAIPIEPAVSVGSAIAIAIATAIAIPIAVAVAIAIDGPYRAEGAAVRRVDVRITLARQTELAKAIRLRPALGARARRSVAPCVGGRRNGGMGQRGVATRVRADGNSPEEKPYGDDEAARTRLHG